jgi:7-cyano-7-deazaguanine synthase
MTQCENYIDGRSAIVLFSGGQDSTICLAWALKHFSSVSTVGFFYGQRHAIELDCRNTVLLKIIDIFPQWAPKLANHRLVDLDFFEQLSDSSLLVDRGIENTKAGLPDTFVPGRNIFFLTAAAALAYKNGITNLIGGMCETDYSGYPDCREVTLRSLEKTLNLGMECELKIHTPLMLLDKAASWSLAHQLGGNRFVEMIVEDTHTCYLGEREVRHSWGYGCGQCPACELRAKGFMSYNSTL